MVSAANRASLVSKYSWCGRPCDLEREEQSSGSQGHLEGGGPRGQEPWSRWETFPEKGQVKVRGPDSLSRGISQTQVPSHSGWMCDLPLVDGPVLVVTVEKFLG